MRHPRFGPPRAVIAAACHALERDGVTVAARSPIVDSDPLGPSRRRYANAVAVVRSALDPEAMLGRLQQVESAFGRIRRGRRWGARVLDLDLVLWSGGPWASWQLTLPHPHFRTRPFVLAPAVTVAPDWRDPMTGLSVRQLHVRLARRTAHSA
ncbi:2-amino-4-hydroxy-6-hydroxymethyldihydropteridine diphosphokinase [Tsuneonella aeria]|nr:2-amino-4-hydroxy-6-hydroxymethyldihydropteridine diphosphokinase [Tsuneonella aeria]